MKSLAFLILIAVPALNAQQNGVNFYSIEKEVALGSQMASDFQRQNLILDDTQVNGYLRSVSDRLLKQIPETAFPFHFAMFADREKSGVHEPHVLPGGYIYIPESLILAARDEAEFAGMLAHAIAHAASRDATQQASRENIASVATIPLIFSGGWQENANPQSARMAIPLSYLRFHRELELEADMRAVSMMAGAGWDPEALARYIEREQPGEDPRKPGTTSRVFAALPPPDERVAAIRKAISNLPPRDPLPSPQFAAIQAEVRRLSTSR